MWTAVIWSQTISYSSITTFTQVPKVQRALTLLQTAEGAISLKASFTHAADPEHTVRLIVALTALVWDGAWTDRQTDRLKILEKNYPAPNHEPNPPWGAVFSAHLALCYSFNVSQLVTPICLLCPLTELYVRSNHQLVEGAHTYVDFTTFSLPAWCTGALSRAVSAVIAAALPVTVTSWERMVIWRTAEMLKQRETNNLSFVSPENGALQRLNKTRRLKSLNNSVNHFRKYDLNEPCHYFEAKSG